MSSLAVTRRTALAALTGALAPAIAASGGSIRVGCQTRAYGSPLPQREKFLEALDGLAAAGYDGFETNFRSLEKYFDSPAAMQAEIAKRGVEMIGLHVGAGLFEPEKIAGERKMLEHVVDGVVAFGGKHVIVSGQRLPETPEGRARPDAIARKAAELDRFGRWCRERGIQLSFHNHTYEVRNDGEEIREILRQSDAENVSLLFDVGHVHNNEVAVPDFVKELAPRIAGLHVRDVAGGDEVMIGAGNVDFEALGRAIVEAQWKGWVIVEVNRRDDIPSREMVDRVRKHLRRTMNI